MQTINDYTLTPTAYHVAEGYVPVIEACGRDDTGKLYRGHVLISQSGFYPRKEDAVAVASRAKVQAVALDGNDLRIRL
jgi:hypothetical protein